jgi:hypothetical protein
MSSGQTMDAIIAITRIDGEFATDHECLEKIRTILDKYFADLDGHPEL